MFQIDSSFQRSIYNRSLCGSKFDDVVVSTSSNGFPTLRWLARWLWSMQKPYINLNSIVHFTVLSPVVFRTVGSLFSEPFTRIYYFKCTTATDCAYRFIMHWVSDKRAHSMRPSLPNGLWKPIYCTLAVFLAFSCRNNSPCSGKLVKFIIHVLKFNRLVKSYLKVKQLKFFGKKDLEREWLRSDFKESGRGIGRSQWK